MLTRSAIGPKSTECVFDILLCSKNISPHLTLGIHTFFLSESIVGRYGHVYEILDANRSAEAFLNAILKLKRNFHLIKIYYFWTFIHSFTHNHFALQRTKKNNISSGIINARHTFSIIHTKTPKLTSRSPSTKRQNWKRNSSTEKNLHAHTPRIRNPRCLKSSYDLPGRRPLECEKSFEKRHHYNVRCCSTDLCNNDKTLTVERIPTRGIFIHIPFPYTLFIKFIYCLSIETKLTYILIDFSNWKIFLWIFRAL